MSDEQTIYISPDDDLTSVRERLEQIPSHKITLVIPSQTQLRSRIAWKLLYARTRELGKEVLIVSSDPQVRSVAHAVNFKVAHSLEPTSSPRRSKRRRESPTPTSGNVDMHIPRRESPISTDQPHRPIPPGYGEDDPFIYMQDDSQPLSSEIKAGTILHDDEISEGFPFLQKSAISDLPTHVIERESKYRDDAEAPTQTTTNTAKTQTAPTRITVKHGKGTDLPGMPPSTGARIGVIYVSPDDDRQAVLTAILKEDRLKREKIVLILPQKNKAFQRPEDFEALKMLRRNKLQAELIFVTPPGPGPAIFARQRSFRVFSTEESFVRSITTGNASQSNQSASAPSQPNKPGKKGLFSIFKKAAPTAAAGAAGSEAASRPPAQRRRKPANVLLPASDMTNRPTQQPIAQRPPLTPHPQMAPSPLKPRVEFDTAYIRADINARQLMEQENGSQP